MTTGQPSSSRPQTAQSSTTNPQETNTAAGGAGAGAAAKLADAIDDFLGDVERKFGSISEEILTKLDDMAERCDRLEAEMLVREAGSSKGTLVSGGEGDL